MKFSFRHGHPGYAGRAEGLGLCRAGGRVVLVHFSLFHQVQSSVCTLITGVAVPKMGGRATCRNNFPVSYCFSHSIILLVSLEWLSNDPLKLMGSCFSASKNYNYRKIPGMTLSTCILAPV